MLKYILGDNMLNIVEIKENIANSYNAFCTKIDGIMGLDNYNQFFGVSKEEAQKRFENLSIEKSGIFDESIYDYKYNGLTNTVIINPKYFNREDINLDNFYMDIVLNIATYNKNLGYSGFGSDVYEALNKGYREMLTLSIVENDRSKEYFESDEYLYANLFSKMYDVSNLMLAYLKNETRFINEFLATKSIPQSELFTNINLEANRNMKVRQTSKGVSYINNIQSKMLDLLLLDMPDRETVDDFVNNIVLAPEVFKDSEKYLNLNSLKDSIQKTCNTYLNSIDNKKVY